KEDCMNPPQRLWSANGKTTFPLRTLSTCALAAVFTLCWIGYGSATRRVDAARLQICRGKGECAGKDPLIRNLRILQQNGARPHWSPEGDAIVFDRRDSSGFAHLFISDLNGNVRPVTAGKPEVGSRNNGNGVFHPSGRFIVFISEEPRHFLERNKVLGDPG